jgi:short-subunit dehydrogenase
MYKIAKSELLIAAHRHRLLGRSVVITGASSGIGAALARAYAGPGVLLALHGRNDERLTQVADSCRARGATVVTHQGDVTDQTHMATWLANVHQQSPLGLVIANAGISGGPANSAHGLESAAQVQAIFATNVQGVLNTLLPCVPLMQAAGGHLAIISSLASFLPFPSAPAYSASKAAVRFWGEALGVALRPRGIFVSVVCPGFIKTPLTATNNFHMPFLMSPEQAAEKMMLGLAQHQPLVVFPLALAWPLQFLAMLPKFLLRPILAMLPAKG